MPAPQGRNRERAFSSFWWSGWRRLFYSGRDVAYKVVDEPSLSGEENLGLGTRRVPDDLNRIRKGRERHDRGVGNPEALSGSREVDVFRRNAHHSRVDQNGLGGRHRRASKTACPKVNSAHHPNAHAFRSADVSGARPLLVVLHVFEGPNESLGSVKI